MLVSIVSLCSCVNTSLLRLNGQRGSPLAWKRLSPNWTRTSSGMEQQCNFRLPHGL